jgi:hypothetical protein
MVVEIVPAVVWSSSLIAHGVLFPQADRDTRGTPALIEPLNRLTFQQQFRRFAKQYVPAMRDKPLRLIARAAKSSATNPQMFQDPCARKLKDWSKRSSSRSGC